MHLKVILALHKYLYKSLSGIEFLARYFVFRDIENYIYYIYTYYTIILYLSFNCCSHFKGNRDNYLIYKVTVFTVL